MENNPELHTPSTSSSFSQWLPLLLMTALISVLFFDVARSFLTALLMAGIAAEISNPINRFLKEKLWGNKILASTGTLIVLLMAIIIPMIVIAGLAANQAAGMTSGAVVLYENLAARPNPFVLPDWLPYEDNIEELWPVIITKIQDLVLSAAGFLAGALAALTKGTAWFFLNLFIFLYAMYFFLQMDRPIISQVLSFTTLTPELQGSLEERIISVSRATLKGTVLIGIIQGGLGGIGFWAAGIQAPMFWAVVMAVASVIPAVGATFVVFGGAIYLGIEGETGKAIILALWAMLVVGSIDNILRPILVGRDAQMHDILILIGTLGGLSVFGAVGLVLGPVLAGLFTTVWTAVRDMNSDTISTSPAEHTSE